MNELELYHYGVKGMKWGVYKAQRKSAANERLKEKALKYDSKSAKLGKKSERAHAVRDLHRANLSAHRATRLKVKAADTAKKSLQSDSDTQRLRLQAKSENLKFKASKAQMRANRISKKIGYGHKAMRYSVRSDWAATRAAKARRTIAKNDAYISMVNKRMSEVSTDAVALGRSVIEGKKED